MAFDVNGVFQRLFNWGNDRDADINIRADRMDGEMDNLADGLTRIVAGDENFRGAIKIPNGVATAPALAFSGSTNTGFYRKPDGNIAFVVAGGEKATITSTGLQLPDNLTLNKALVGGLAARSTSGTLDWNAEVNSRVGVGDVLLQGTTSQNSPTDTAEYYIPLTFGYAPSANARTQFAIPYFGGGVHYRHRNPNNGLWEAWRKVWDSSTDGAGSGLDADLLDGQQGAFYQNAGNLNAGTLPSARLSGSYAINAATASNATVHIQDTSNPHNVTKAQVGLGNVTNTSDIQKPVSTAQQTALNGKYDKTGGAISGDIIVAGRLQGGLRVPSTLGQLDWDNVTNSESGMGRTLLRGLTAANSPVPGSSYYHYPMTFDFAGVNRLQFALPYTSDAGVFYRTRISGDWSAWVSVTDSNNLGLTKSYESAATAWVANSISTFNHGLGVMPKIVEAVLVMKQAVHGYAIGDEVRLSSDGQFGSTIYSTASTVRFRSTTASGVYTTRAIGAVAYITPAQANLKIRAFA